MPGLALYLLAPVVFASSGGCLRADAPVGYPVAPGTAQPGLIVQRPSSSLLRQDSELTLARGLAVTSSKAGARTSRAEEPPSGKATTDCRPARYWRTGLGGELRAGFERIRDTDFGEIPGTDNSWRTRLNLYTQVSAGDHFRLVGALKTGNRTGLRPASDTSESDGPDLHLMFAQLGVGQLIGLPRSQAFIRLGRQEWHYGAGRIISVRSGPNLRRDFDGAVFRARGRGWTGELAWMRPVEGDSGDFNNGNDLRQRLWALYLSAEPDGLGPGLSSRLPGFNLDVYSISANRQRSPYAFAPARMDESRHTIGARLWRAQRDPRGWQSDFEVAAQFGSAQTGSGQSQSIRAAMLAGSFSWQPPRGAQSGLARLGKQAEVALRFHVSSGDDDPSDNRLQTWRAPFPSGRYFGKAASLGPGNLFSIGPSLSVSPVQRLRLTARWELFRRLSVDDGLYTTPPFVLRGATGSERRVGSEVSLSASYRITPATRLSASLALFEAGPYFTSNQPGRDIRFAELVLDIRF